MAAPHRPTDVVLEVARTKSFASAVDWPGWCRPGPTPDAALQALADYAPRYAAVAAVGRVRFSAAAGAELRVVEELPGDSSTTFGAPGVQSASDSRPLGKAEADRQVRLLRAGWDELDRLAVEAPESLRKGPRGGGRDRDKVVAHVIEAERSYARKIGVRHPPFHGDPAALSRVPGRGRAGAARGPVRRPDAGLAGPLLPAPGRLARARPRLGDRGQVRARLIGVQRPGAGASL